MEKYLNDAIIGNKNMLATFSSKGEMLRLSYPNHDNRQYLKYFHTGVKVNDSNIIYLHDDINNKYIQYYDTVHYICIECAFSYYLHTFEK